MQRPVAIDHGLLMREVPHAGAPVLQIHVTQPGPRSDEDLDGPAVQTGGRDVVGRGFGGGLGHERGFGALFQNNQGVPEVDAARR